MYLDKLNPFLGQSLATNPFDITQQLGSQGLQSGMQTKNKVEGVRQTAMNNHMAAVKQQEEEEAAGLNSLLNIGMAFATGGASAGLGALAGEAIGGPVGDIVGMAVGGKFGGGNAANAAGNAVADNLVNSQLGNTMSQVGGHFGDYLNRRNNPFFGM